MPENQSAPIETVDRILLNLDEGPFGALYRILIGFATIPAMEFVFGSAIPAWTVIPFLLFVLLLLRVSLAIARKLVPFSAAATEAWSVRRRTAKLYDSYQWRKVIWIGTGLALYIVITNRSEPVQIALALFCILAGVAGTLIWRTIAADSKYPKPLSMKKKRTA